MSSLFDNVYIAIIPALLSIFVFLIDIWIMRRVKKEQVIVAEAGKISEMRKAYQPYVYMNPISISMFNKKGLKKAIPADLQRVIVHGHCMEPRGIMDCSQLYVQNIANDKDFSLQVKHDDILLIYLPDKNIYKLRVFDKYLDQDLLLTYRYNPQTGDRIDSSKPHNRKNVVGVVKFTL